MNAQEQLIAMKTTMQGMNKENECYKQIYGTLPEGAYEGDKESHIKLPEKFQKSLEYSSLLEGEVEAISNESRLVRYAIAEIKNHLLDQRDIFGEVRRLEMSKALSFTYHYSLKQM